MKTRIAVLAMMMTAGGLFIQPVTAAAADFNHDQHAGVERAPVVRRGDRDDRWRAHDRCKLPYDNYRR